MGIENSFGFGDANVALSKKSLIERVEKKELTKGPGESQSSYLWRIGEEISREIKKTKGLLTDINRLKESDLSEDVLRMIDDAIIEAMRSQEEVFDFEKNENVIRNIDEAGVGYHGKGELFDSNTFDTTERNRRFFEIQQGKGASRRETYWNTLFFPYNTEATREFARKILDGKRVVLLGGGRSQLKKELVECGINPREVVNIDPFVENIEEVADPVIPLNVADKNFIKEMSDWGIDGADEILAEYSVPAYLEDPKEIKQLFENIDAFLVEGGSARIWPIEVGGSGSDLEKSERKNALLESLRKINEKGGYEIILYKSAGRHGMILRKLIPSIKK